MTDLQKTGWIGLLIKTFRRKLGWSQESLCHGICSVSYLSKIESGNTSVSPEILELLATRLNMPLPFSSQADLEKQQTLLQLLQAGQMKKAGEAFAALQPSLSSSWKLSPTGLLLSLLLGSPDPAERKNFENSDENAQELSLFFISETGWQMLRLEKGIEACLDSFELSLYFFLQKNYEKSLLYADQAWLITAIAYGLYTHRVSESRSLDVLEQADQLAWKEGQPVLMGMNGCLRGTIYSNMNEGDIEKALSNFRRAQNLFSAVQDEKMLDEIAYNIACTCLEAGQFEEACQILENVKNPGIMDRIKLAVCYEQLGRKEQALSVLETAGEYNSGPWDSSLLEKILSMMKLRLQDPDYLKNTRYGKLLGQVFKVLSESPVHKGFARFYLPWMIQWYKANRQYAKLVSLYEQFPGRAPFRLAEALQ